MRVKELSAESNIEALLKKIGVDGGGKKILQKKAKLHFVAIDDLHVGAANILKQDALSVGADLAVPKGTIVAQTPKVDTLLIATTKELEILAKKELAQPFGLKEVAQRLKQIAAVQRVTQQEIMGVINANDDSFYAKSRFDAKGAQAAISQMIEEGADIIDIGAVSSRPGAACVSQEEELARFEPIAEIIASQKIYNDVRFSIDSYTPAVIEVALESGFSIVNDITGLNNSAVGELAAKYDAALVIMHMQGDPQTMQHNPYYEDVLDEVYSFFEERIEKAESLGIKEIILDVGIGFGKRLQDNISLIKNLRHFASLQKKLLVGASRKSMIDAITPAPSQKRLPGTLALHLEAAREGASILRVHDVAEHLQALKTAHALWDF